MSKMKMYSVEKSGSKMGNGPWKTRLNPLVRTSSVLPSGLTEVLTACPAIHSTGATCGSNESVTVIPVSRNWKFDPGIASGVMVCARFGTA